MESLEHLIKRIDYGRSVENESAKMFFSLEPTLRFALINFLLRKHSKEVDGKPLTHMSILELINIFDQVAGLDEATSNRIYELYNAVTNYRMITYLRVHAANHNVAFKMGQRRFNKADHYLQIMEEVVRRLLNLLRAT